MDNVFLNDDHSVFSWNKMGDIEKGRGSLGEEMPVLVYRLMQFTMLDVLTRKFDREQANNFIREAGHLAGVEFSKNVLDLTVDFDTFVANLQKVLQQFKIGILRMENFNVESGEIMLTVQVGFIHHVPVHKHKLPDAAAGQHHGAVGAESSGPGKAHTGGGKFGKLFRRQMAAKALLKRVGHALPAVRFAAKAGWGLPSL